MAFDTRWNSSGIGFNGAGIRITGITEHFLVKWGDGPAETVIADQDTDGDGVADTAEVFHDFPSDGNYDIAVFQSPNPGVPPIRLKAYMHTSETTDLVFKTSNLQDMVLTGSGDDDIWTANGDDWVDAGAGNDRVAGGDGSDVLLGAAGDDSLKGGAGFDLLAGGAGRDVLRGETDDDYLYGDADRDTLYGDAGDDYLTGGAGADRLTGGSGADTFAFGPPPLDDGGFAATDPDRDTILDFEQGTDHIAFADWDATFAFIGGSRFTGDGAQLRAVANNGVTVIFGDADGDRIADFSIRVEGVIELTAGDFFL